MGDDDAGDAHAGDGRVHRLLVHRVEMRGAFVHQQDLGLAIKRAGQQHALLLPARKRAAHVPHQRFVLHRHRRDIGMDAGRVGGGHHPLLVHLLVEQGDVVGQRPCEQRVFLQHGGDLGVIAAVAEALQRHAIDQHLAAVGIDQAQHDLHHRGLAAARRPGDRHMLARLDLQVHPVEHHRVARRIAVEDVLQLQPAFQRRVEIGAFLEAAVFLRQRDVAEAFEVQRQHAEGDELVDQRRRFLDELGLVAHVGEDHADAEAGAFDHEADRKIDRDDVFEREDQRVAGLLPDADARQAHVGVDGVGQLRLPQRVAQCLAPEQAQRGDAAQALDQRGLFLAAGDDAGFLRFLLHREGNRPDHAVKRESGDRDEGQRRAVEEHHHQRQDRQHPVEHGGDCAFGQQLADGGDGLEAGQDVARVAFLEPVDRQAEQAPRDVARQRVAQRAAGKQQHEGSQDAGACLDQRKYAEAHGQYRQQVQVLFRQRAVDRDLHVIGQGEDIGLQHDAEHEDLQQRAFQPAHVAPQVRQLQPLALRSGFEIVARPQFQRHAGEVVRHLVHRHPLGTAFRIVDQRLARLHLLDDHIVVHVPVEHGGHVQVAELFQRQLHRPRGQADAVGKADQRAQRRAAQRRGEPPAHGAQVHVEPVVIGDHRQAGEAAFRNLRLADEAHAAAAEETEVEHVSGSLLQTAARTAIRAGSAFRR